MKYYHLFMIAVVCTACALHLHFLIKLDKIKKSQQITHELYKQNLINEYNIPFTNCILVGRGAKANKNNELVITFTDGTELRTNLKPIRWQ